MTLFDLRKEFGLSQRDAAKISGVPLRTYIRYEGDNEYGSSLKRSAMIKAINDACEITEEKGVLTIDQIMKGVNDVIKKEYQDSVGLCYLFGSYAKGYANERSDIDLFVSTTLTGFKFAGLAEKIRLKLHKMVELVELKNASKELIFEIMKDGIKIYG